MEVCKYPHISPRELSVCICAWNSKWSREVRDGKTLHVTLSHLGRPPEGKCSARGEKTLITRVDQLHLQIHLCPRRCSSVSFCERRLLFASTGLRCWESLGGHTFSSASLDRPFQRWTIGSCEIYNGSRQLEQSPIKRCISSAD